MVSQHVTRARTRPAPRAFSLLELLVVVFIFSLISTVVLTNHTKFSSSVLLGSLAYDMALSIREAQVYGLSVQGQSSSVNSTNITNFNVNYGVHFSDPASYIFFADVDGNKKYDAAAHGNFPPDTIVKNYAVSSQYSVSRFCGITSNGGTHCSDGTGGTTITSLDIAFVRPDPDANISSNVTNGYSSATIQVKSQSGETRTVTVASTGQISVTNP